jgi:hypothetical protein
MLKTLVNLCSWKLVAAAGVVYVGLLTAGTIYFASQAVSLVDVQRTPIDIADPLAVDQSPS